MNSTEQYFEKFRNNVVGNDATFESPYGIQKIIYADWIASGRLYAPIEDKIKNTFGPLVGNTHSEASETGVAMTHAYHKAQQIIKKHVNAGEDDVLLTLGQGMTSAVNKFMRILGLKIPEQIKAYMDDADKQFYAKVFPGSVSRKDLMRLRRMRFEDLPTVLQIEAKNYNFPWSEQIFEEC
ncbi:MAG: hypothetical protein L3J74_06905, partial [Bacteroidales bacterium]|nr:hypothetical protein [Bacteroidales bacterium]